MNDFSVSPDLGATGSAGRTMGGSGSAGPTIGASVAIMSVGLVAAALARLPLAWDGAWFLVRAMDTGTPTFLYRRAFHAVLQAPALAARSVDGDPTVLAVLFSAGYVLVPLVGLLASWRIARDRPELLLWPTLGIALVTLPGQAFFIGEAGWVAHLTWPLLLAATLGRVHRHRILVGGVAIALLSAHPLGAPSLVIVGIASGIARWRGNTMDSRWVALGFLGIGIGFTLIGLAIRAPYEADAATVDHLLSQFRGAVLTRAAIAPVAAWVIGALAVVRLPPRVRTIATAVLLAVAAAVLVRWAGDPSAWVGALRFRSWFVLLPLPLIALAILDAGRPRPWADRRVALIGAPLVMAVTLCVQSVVWLDLQGRLATTIAAAPPGCIERASLGWIGGTALDHWGTTSLGIILDGRSPTHLVLVDRPCDGAVSASGVVIKSTPFDRDVRPVGGWWGFDALVDDWRDAPPP